MNLSDLRKSFRVKTGDLASPYLWKDEEIDGYINEALVEAVDRGLTVFDRDSFTVDVEVGVTAYQLDASIIRVKEVWVTTKDGIVLDAPELMHPSRAYAGYERDVFSELSQDSQGYRVEEDGLFVLGADPAVSAVLSLVVHRYARTLEDDSDTPEIANMYHNRMLEWALKLAYLKQDADAFDPNASDRHDAEFSRTFGPPKTAQQHRQRRRKAARSYKTPCY